MSVRDAARVGAAFVDGLAPLLADDAFGLGPSATTGTTTATTNPTTPKVARASPAATRSAEERRPA